MITEMSSKQRGHALSIRNETHFDVFRSPGIFPSIFTQWYPIEIAYTERLCVH